MYLASRKSDGKAYAVKMMDKSMMRLQHLFEEINVLSMLDHPKVVNLVNVFENGSHIYLVHDALLGGELFDHIILNGGFSEADASNIVGQLLSAIQFIHGKGLVHRDIKPENILFMEPDSLEIKLCDFGVAKRVRKDEKGNVTLLHTITGTPNYVAPEVLTASTSKGYGKQVHVQRLRP